MGLCAITAQSYGDFMKARDLNRGCKVYKYLYTFYYKSLDKTEYSKTQREKESEAFASGCLYHNHLPGFGVLTQLDVREIAGLRKASFTERMNRFDERMECLDYAQNANKLWKQMREELEV